MIVKMAFDIGGVLSRYPKTMASLVQALHRGGIELYVVTDMKKDIALQTLRDNNFLQWFDEDHVLSADWSTHGDLCKTVLCEEHGIQILVDDRPDYVAQGAFVGLALSPRPHQAYYHLSWINHTSMTVCVPPEEYEEFKAWRASRRNEVASET